MNLNIEEKTQSRRSRRGKKNSTKNQNSVKSLQKRNTLFSLLSEGIPCASHYVPDNQVYKVTQTQVAGPVLTSSTTLPIFVARNFQLSFIDQAASWTSIFDQYRIDQIEYLLIPRQIDSVATATNLGLLASVIDYDDATALTTFPSALDYSNCLVGSGTQAHYRVFKPHVADAVYSGSFTSFSNTESEWIDAASPTVQHYGIKLACQATTNVQIYDEIVRYHISFRNVR